MIDVCKKMDMRDADIQKDIRALIDKMENYNSSITSSLRLKSFNEWIIFV